MPSTYHQSTAWKVQDSLYFRMEVREVDFIKLIARISNTNMADSMRLGVRSDVAN